MTETKFKEYLEAKGLSISSIRQYLSYYRMFQRLVERRGLDQDVVNLFIKKHTSNVARSFLRNLFDFFDVRELKIPKRTGRVAKKKRRTISKAEIKHIRKRAYNYRVKFGLMIDLCYHCALRRAEVLNVQVDNFDFLRWAEEKNKRGCRLKIKGKGNKERIVIVPPKLTKRIIAFIEHKEK